MLAPPPARFVPALAPDRLRFKPIRIGSVGDACASATTIDGTGKYLIPGLVDAHVHLWKKSDLHAALQAGVLAVFDLHSSEGPDASFRQLALEMIRGSAALTGHTLTGAGRADISA